MAAQRKKRASEEAPSRAQRPQRPPAPTRESRENQLINLAFNEAERQLREQTASSQVITHYLKLGSTRERLEHERLLREIDLMEKKIEVMDSAKRIEELYESAIQAMRSYDSDAIIDDGYRD